MTVSELIMFLRPMNPEALVYVEDSENDSLKLAQRVVAKEVLINDDERAEEQDGATGLSFPAVIISRFSHDPIEKS